MLGFLTGIEANHKQLEKASTGQEVCVKIEPVPGEAPKLYGRHFTDKDLLVSRVSTFYYYSEQTLFEVFYVLTLSRFFCFAFQFSDTLRLVQI